MPSDVAANSFKPDKRLHPVSWLFVAITYLKQSIAAIVAVVFIGAQNDYALWSLLFVIPIIVGAIWQQWIYRYGFSARGLVIHEGLIFRNVRTIDYARIENVDTERGLLHRLLGVAEVRVETSSGGKAEARIRVLGLPAIQEIRARIFAHRDETTEPTPEQQTAPGAAPETLLHLPPAELVRFGLIDNRGIVVIAALFGLLAQGGFFAHAREWATPVIEWLPWEDLARFGVLTQVLLGIATLVGLLAGTRVLSIIMAFITLFDFRLTRQGGDLRNRYGLLTHISLTLRQSRIQAVHQTTTLLHRLFKRVSLRVDLAGGTSAGNGGQGGNQAGGKSRELWLAPICPTADAERLIRVALPVVNLSNLNWQGLAPRARWRLFRLWSWLWLLLAGVPVAWFAGWWALLLLAMPLPLFWAHVHLYVKHTGWALHEDFFVLRRGWLTRKLSVAPRNRIQSIQLSESPFDQRYRMAGLTVDTAGADAWSQRLHIPYLDRAAAAELAAALYRSGLATNDAP